MVALVGALACSEALAQGVEYQPDLVLTLGRADIEFMTPLGFDDERDGQWLTVDGIFGGVDAFWLCYGDGLHEYSLEGLHIRSISSGPVETSLPREDILVTSDQLFLLRMTPGYARASIEVLDLSRGTWQMPVSLTLSDSFGGSRAGWGTRVLAAVGDEVLVVNPRASVALSVASDGSIRQDLESTEPMATGVFRKHDRWVLPKAKNYLGAWLRVRHPHFSDVPSENYTDLEVVSASGEVMGWLRDNPDMHVGGRELQPTPRWALLADGTVLFVRSVVSGKATDRIEVFHWSP
jgi:hypothetical protein